MKKINFSFLIWFLFYALIFFFLLYNSFSYLDPDLGWHLKAGQEILNNQSVPKIEIHDYTLAGKNWVDHEWFLNLISYLIFNKFGYLVLSVIFALLIVITLIILNAYIKKYFLKNKKQFFFLIFFEIIGVLAMAPHLGVRMQEIALLNLLLLLIIIHKYSQNKNYKILFWLLPLFYFWANVHASFLIGLFILFFWIIISLIEIIIQKKYNWSWIKYRNLSYKNIFIFTCFFALSFLLTLFTPYKLQLYHFLFGYARNTYYLTHIKEWLPIYYNHQFTRILYSAFIFLALYSTIYSVFKKQNTENKNKINLWQIAIVFLFFFLAIKSLRHFTLFFIVSLPFLAKTVEQYLIIPLNFSWLKKNIIIQSYIILIFVLSSLFIILKTNFTNHPFTNPKYCKIYPCQTVSFLKNNSQLAKKKIFSLYGWGGFLIWTWPEKKLFLDGRLPQYNFANHTILEEYYSFFNKNKVKEKLNKYNIELVLLPPKKEKKTNWLDNYLWESGQNNNNKNYLLKYLKNAQNWQLKYKDKTALIYAKK